MFTHIIGTENRYYQSEEEANAGATPAITRQITARANPDNKTWMVSSTVSMRIIADTEAVSLKVRLARAIGLRIPVEKSSIITRNASLTEAYNLIRADEENPKYIRELSVLRQHNNPEDTYQYWRNMIIIQRHHN